jgi:hypothetical protein
MGATVGGDSLRAFRVTDVMEAAVVDRDEEAGEGVAGRGNWLVDLFGGEFGVASPTTTYTSQ